MRQLALAVTAALLIVACDVAAVEPTFQPACVIERREARDRYGPPSSFNEYTATGYHAITYHWQDHRLSMRFVSTRGSCSVSTYRSR